MKNLQKLSDNKLVVISLVLLSTIAIYKAGKCAGEFLFYIIN